MKHLAAALLVALCAFAVACDDSDSEESSSENGEETSDNGDDGDSFDAVAASSVVFQGEELPINRVRCEEWYEDSYQVFASFDLEPRNFTDVVMRGTTEMTLRLPTQVDAEDEFDVWEPTSIDDLDISEKGAFGTLEMEGLERGAGEPPGGTLEVDVHCPR